MTQHRPDLALDPDTQFVTVVDETPTVSQLWDASAQQAVVAEAPGPTVASRAFAMTHTAIFDAWASYDPQAVATTLGDSLQQEAGAITDANKAAAMSWAAYTVLTALFPAQAAIFDARMAELGLGTDPDALPADSAAALGRTVGEAVLADRADDGANQAGGYADISGYAPVNSDPLGIVDITRWTPESVPVDPEDVQPEQSFLTPHWGGVRPFGLADGADLRPVAPEPFILPGVDATLDMATGTIVFGGETPPAPVPVSRDLIGSVINPAFIAQAEQVVAFSAGLTDEQKLIAEFWEDGGGTAFPPGSWMTFGQYVSARDDHGLDEDAKLFFVLANAVMDAGIATWEAKTFYDYVRPVRAIRELGELGLIGEPGVDALTGESGFVVEAWAGPGRGTATILAENFITYQTPGRDVSPPFAEYTSGHSGFSAAGAAVLELFTRSDAFGASVAFAPGSSRFEPGQTPESETVLAWDSFSAAADEAGISRLFGGIHFEDGDLNGRKLGEAVGQAAFREAFGFIAGEGEGGAAEGAVVGRLFESALGRVAKFGGLNHWEDGLAEGRLSERDLAEAFLLSEEFAIRFAPAGSLPAEDFVDLLFGNVGLDRAATELDEELLDRAGSGAGEAELLLAFAASAEVIAETGYLAALNEDGEGALWFV